MKKRLDKKKTVARAIARKTERYIATGMSPKNAGELARDEVKHFLNAFYRPRIKPSHKSCPICGRSRRTGYFKACGGCYEILEWRERLDRFFNGRRASFKGTGADLRWRYEGYRIILEVIEDVKAEVVEDGKIQNRRLRFTASQVLSLGEVKALGNLGQVLAKLIVELYGRAHAEAQAWVDENDRALSVGGLLLPTAGGKWGSRW